MRPRPSPHAAALVLLSALGAACARERGDVRPVDSTPAVAMDSAAAPAPRAAGALADTTVGTSPADSASEPPALRAAGDRVRRDGLALHLALDGGGRATIVDDTSAESLRRHTYLGRARGAPFHVLRVSRFEGREYLLVHARTGRRVLVDAPPVVSPDGARFVTAVMDLSAEFDPTRLTIWRLDADSAVREWSHEPTTWGPSDAHWRDDRTVTFTINEPYEDDATRVRRRPGRVVREGERWMSRERE